MSYRDKLIEAHMTDPAFRKKFEPRKKKRILEVNLSFLKKVKGCYVLLNKENEFLTKKLDFTKALERACIFEEWIDADEQNKKIENCRIVII